MRYALDFVQAALERRRASWPSSPRAPQRRQGIRETAARWVSPTPASSTATVSSCRRTCRTR
ncbi:MAG: hypothetical protein MZV70_28695 [Desulfobacterales bacterium]|nr:hypothetical protein [Desulfobacterales bacterium]